MIIILFGLSGAGKNFVGELLQNEFGYYYWDADQALSEEMQQHITQKKAFTQSMRDELVHIVINKIAQLKPLYPNVVISQALYKEQNRAQLQKAYPDIKMFYVQANSDLITQRLMKRNGLVNVHYAKKIAVNFEIPQQPDAIIRNNGDAAAIIDQLKFLI